jgi:hypothetical protein
MRGNPHRIQVIENVFGNAVVEDALAVDNRMFLGIEGGRVVLEMLDQRARLRALIEDLGLAFVNSAAAVHGSHWSVYVDAWRG